MFRAALACLLFALPVSSFAVPVTDDPDATANVGPLADRSASRSLDFDDSFVSAARNVVIAARPAFADGELSWDGVRYEESPSSAQPGLIDGRLVYLGANLTLLAVALTIIWYLSRYGRRTSKRRARRSRRTRRAR